MTQGSVFGAIGTIVLMLAWILFDHVIDPENFKTFLILRILCVLVLLVGLVAYIRADKKTDHYRKFYLLIYTALLLTILPMCIITSEKYPYYIGLSTVFFAASILCVWPLHYFLIPMILSGLVLGLAEWGTGSDPQVLVTGVFLLANVVALSTIASWLTYQNFLKNEKLLNQLQELSNTDRLTGLNNRRYFDIRLQNELASAARNDSITAVLMLDVDHFKKYNDHYGHQRGDECLCQVSNCLREALSRKTDFIARYGGEEFVVVLPDTDINGAEIVAKRIIASMDELGTPHCQSPTAPFVTLSIGIACRNATLAKDLVSLADSALYKAKHEGRHRFVVG